MLLALRATGGWDDRRSTNLLDGGAPFYDTYACRDGGFVAVGALEPQFFRALVTGLDVPVDEAEQHDRSTWDRMRALFTHRFAERDRDDWARHFEGMDACVTPVLTYAEAPEHPHLKERGTFLDLGGVVQAAPAPRFSRTPAPAPASPSGSGGDEVGEVLRDWRR
jgi:alpha-methylacyl-CoA racemase